MSTPRVDVVALATKVENMTAADQLRLAAGLLDRGQHDLAEVIVRNVSDALHLLRLVGGARR